MESRSFVGEFLMEVKVIDVMGTDLTVVNARVSFKKEHIKFDYEKDEKLIKYLATHDSLESFWTL